MFDEVVLSLNLGCRISAGHLVVGRFGQNQAKQSVVAISQTLDKLVVHDPSLVVPTNGAKLSVDAGSGASKSGADADNDSGGGGSSSISPASLELHQPPISRSVYYIAVKDVIRTVSVRSLKLRVSPEAVAPTLGPTETNKQSRGSVVLNGGLNTGLSPLNRSNSIEAATQNMTNQPPSTTTTYSKDLLLIGCSNSILIYDALSQTNLLSINTPTPVSAITGEPPRALLDRATPLAGNSWPIICGGNRRIYALKFDGPLFDWSNNFNGEISSERSTGDTINCLAQGTLNGLDLVITGSSEQKIRLYPLDSFEQNIQTCKLTIDELAPINCVCPINTGSTSGQRDQNQPPAPTESVLPSVQGAGSRVSGPPALDAQTSDEQMNYFAYGLENGIIGVYRLFLTSSLGSQTSVTVSSERLWRHKCKQTPLTMLMYDINGDGLDELIVGFGSSRIEARSPFTGQLLATTRCFKIDRLAGLAAIDHQNDGNLMLIACSVAGALVGFKPRVCRPRRALQGYSLPTARNTIQQQQATASGEASPWLDELATAGEVDYSTSDWSAARSVDPATAATLAISGVTNLKTIEEQQEDRDVFMMMKEAATAACSDADLHIETQNDDTKPGKCDARQSHELLLRVNALRGEQMDLERRACHIYHRSLQQATDFYPIDVSIGHRWDFDSGRAYLRLTIVISSGLDEVKLIELEDKSFDVLPKGHLLLQPNRVVVEPTSGSNWQHNEQKKSHVVVVPFRTKKDAERRLSLRIFCESKRPAGSRADGGGEIVGRVYCKSIDVPRFSMIAFAPDQQAQNNTKITKESSGASEDESGFIRIAFNFNRGGSKLAEILDWLDKSFLCFRFGWLIENSGDGSDIRSSSSSSNNNSSWIRGVAADTFSNLANTGKGRLNLMMDDTESFELNLLDIRYTLNRMSQDSAVPHTNLVCSNQQQQPDELEQPVPLKDLQSKFTRLASTLKIAYSNGQLKFESQNFDLVVGLVQSLLVDRLHLNPSAGLTTDSSSPTSDDKQYEKVVVVVADVNVEPILNELDTLTNSSRELEESERRIQTELYESADYTKSLLQQFAIANELNEFTTAKELLNELFMMLNGAQNAARAQCLNNRSRLEISKQVNELKEKLSFLMGHFV